jgi:hypothetical protein
MSNVYDRVWRENIGDLVLPLASKYFGFKIVSVKELPDKIQLTRDREVDYASIVREEGGREFILHVEFQTTNDRKMHLRMLDYHASLILKYGMPIFQAVIYLGRAKPTFRTELKDHEVMQGFRLLDIGRMPSRDFLDPIAIGSEMPAEIIMAILADFEGKDPATVIRYLTKRIMQVSKDEAQLGKFLNQLRIISQISKLELEVTQEIENMPLNIDITKDPWFKRREKRGEKHNKELTALNILKVGELSEAKIAMYSGLSIEEVVELKKRLEN